jgi:hypothetical protein
MEADANAMPIPLCQLIRSFINRTATPVVNTNPPVLVTVNTNALLPGKASKL